MQFHERETTYQTVRRRSGYSYDADRFYLDSIERFRRTDPDAAGQMRSEWNWTATRRPYYSVWPTIIPMLVKLNLAIKSSEFRIPLTDLLVRLPQMNNPLGFESGGQRHEVRSILASQQQILPGGDRQVTSDGMGLWVDIGELADDIPVYSYINFRTVAEMSLEESLGILPAFPSSNRGVSVPTAIMHDCVRLVCTIGLIADDPELIKPDVLADDRNNYAQTGDQKYVEKAQRRGKIGWNIGEDIEHCPHYRRPHLALRWTGSGGLIPKIVPVKGAFVNRQKASDVPTGYLDDEESPAK